MPEIMMEQIPMFSQLAFPITGNGDQSVTRLACLGNLIPIPPMNPEPTQPSPLLMLPAEVEAVETVKCLRVECSKA